MPITLQQLIDLGIDPLPQDPFLSGVSGFEFGGPDSGNNLPFTLEQQLLGLNQNAQGQVGAFPEQTGIDPGLTLEDLVAAIGDPSLQTQNLDSLSTQGRVEGLRQVQRPIDESLFNQQLLTNLVQLAQQEGGVSGTFIDALLAGSNNFDTATGQFTIGEGEGFQGIDRFGGSADQIIGAPIGAIDNKGLSLPAPQGDAQDILSGQDPFTVQTSRLVQSRPEEFGRDAEGDLSPIAQAIAIRNGLFQPGNTGINFRGGSTTSLGQLDPSLSLFDRARQVGTIRDDLNTAGGPEGLTPEEINQILSTGLLQRNQGFLSNQPDQAGFDAIFGRSDLSGSIFDEELFGRRDTSLENVNTQFGDINLDEQFAFDPELIERILGERQTRAGSAIGNFAARGNLSPQGAATANSALADQLSTARPRLDEIATGAQQEGRNSFQDIFDRARNTATSQTFQNPFSIDPFQQEIDSLFDVNRSTFEDRLRSGLGEETLFSPQTAQQFGGADQGLVSGVPSNVTGLDVLAARSSAPEGDPRDRRRRGLNTSGSGAF